jgi:chromosome segregation ATPase
MRRKRKAAKPEYATQVCRLTERTDLHQTEIRTSNAVLESHTHEMNALRQRVGEIESSLTPMRLKVEELEKLANDVGPRLRILDIAMREGNYQAHDQIRQLIAVVERLTR